ncbi:MAG: ester cyclase [Solirubrobacteraceae bacterium]
MAATAPPANASNTELVRWAFDVINSHDVSPLREVWTSETLEQLPDRTCRGADELARHFDELFAAVPDVHMDVLQAIGEGDDVFARWHLTGTHTGAAWSGVDATGARIELDGIDHYTVRDGRIVSNFVVFDQMVVGRAMGVLPPDGSAPDRALKAAFNAKTKVAEAIRNARG